MLMFIDFFTELDGISGYQQKKRKNLYMLEVKKKIQKLEEENKTLKHQMACCKESCGKNLQLQADALKVLNEQEKRKYMTKIIEKKINN